MSLWGQHEPSAAQRPWGNSPWDQQAGTAWGQQSAWQQPTTPPPAANPTAQPGSYGTYQTTTGSYHAGTGAPVGSHGTPAQQFAAQPGYPQTQAAYPPSAPGHAGQSWPAPQTAYPAAGFGYATPVRPKRRSSLRSVLIVLFVLFVLPNLWRTVMSVLSTPTTTYPTSYPTTATATSTSTASPQSNPDPTSGYYHDDYQVPAINLNPPDLPAPTTYNEAQDWLNSNSFYSMTLAVPVRCEITEFDLSTASREQLQAHFDALTECLMRVWAPTLEQAGFEAVRPSVTVYSGSAQSACGSLESGNAVYCGADQQIYYATDLPYVLPSEYRSLPFVVDSILAHEFAHSLQGRTGLLIASAAWQQRYEDAGDEANANDISRRSEVQADCWAGQYLQAITYSAGVDEHEATNVGQMFYYLGDDVLTGVADIDGNHGWGSTRQNWFTTGYQSTSVGACNSYTAAADEVR